MAQRYDNNFVSLIRTTSTASLDIKKNSNNDIEVTSDQNTLQTNLVVEYGDNNQKIFRELTILTNNSFDETYTPVTGDLTYQANSYIGLIQPVNATKFETYNAGGTTVAIQTDKNTLLDALKNNYGDGKFRVFQEVVQSHTHGFVLEP